MLTNSGVDSQYISTINNLITNNYNVTANSIATIASVTKELQNANASSNVIIDVQKLLLEVIVSNGTINETYTYVPGNYTNLNIIISNNVTTNTVSNTTSNAIVYPATILPKIPQN